MKHLENLKSVDLMTWETVEKKRNINNEISFYLEKDVTVEVNDIIIGTYNTQFFSGYLIEEIIETRKGRMKNKILVLAKTSWKNYAISDLKGVNHDHISISLSKLSNK